MSISTGGQISIPAMVRRRWGTTSVVLEDRGDHLVLRPVADDPIAAAEGSLSSEFGKLDVPLLRRRARGDEQAAERRRGG